MTPNADCRGPGEGGSRNEAEGKSLAKRISFAGGPSGPRAIDFRPPPEKFIERHKAYGHPSRKSDGSETLAVQAQESV